MAALAVLLSAVTAAAQQSLTVETPTITAPRLVSDSGVAYPAQALRDHVVERVTIELVLSLDRDGRVQAVTIERPHGHGFDEAATAAARKLVFEPALRNAHPVPARIKFRYEFIPPAAKLTGRVVELSTERPIAGATVAVRDAAGGEHSLTSDADGRFGLAGLPPGAAHLGVSAPGCAPQSSDETLEAGQDVELLLRLGPAATSETPEATTEVAVRGTRPPREVTKRTLSRDEIMHSAGTQGDALLSVQNLPGIARPPPFSGALVVRGSAPEDTNVFIDGTNVPLVYHFGGLSSVVPTELLDRIDFYPGNYSARYGRGMGGVVEAGLRAPKTDGYHLTLEGSVLGLRAIVEGPIGKGWSFFAAGQRSWLDVVFTPILKAEGAEQTALPRWADYQLGLQKDFGAASSFRVLFFGSDDAFDIVNPIPAGTDPTLGGALGYHTNFWRLQTRLDSTLTPSTELHLMAAFGQDTLTANIGSYLIDATLHPLSGRAELSQKVLRGLTANVGLDLMYQPYEYALQLPPETREGAPPPPPGSPLLRSVATTSVFLPGTYAELEIAPWTGARFVPGARLDYDDATERWDFSPRINARQELASSGPKTALKGGIGVFVQPPGPLDTDRRFGQPGLSSNRTVQSDVGIEQELFHRVELCVDAFHKRFSNLVVPGAGNRGSGDAFGVEWLLRYKPDGHFFGWLSYTLSRSERRDVPEEPSRLFHYDQTHVLTLLGNYKFGSGWQFGARYRLTSGDLYTTATTGAYNATVGTQLGVSAFPPYDARMPLFHQLDLRLEKSRDMPHSRWTFFVDVQNVYYAKNPLGVTYNYDYTRSAFLNGLPILPILGLRVEVH